MPKEREALGSGSSQPAWAYSIFRTQIEDPWGPC